MPRATATANGVTLAETSTWEIVDGNIYFPPNSIQSSAFTPTEKHTFCPYKGTASYYTVSTGKTELKDAAWYYPEPKQEYEKIRGFVAFYKGQVEVSSE